MNPRSIDKQQAQELIKETFESSFDKSGFTNFIKNLLNRIDDAPFIYQGNYIPDAYKQYIKTLERIGKFSDGENRIDILVITLQKDTSLERARTMQRNFIAWYLNGSRGGKLKEAALAAFVSPGKEDWRFSLVKMDYKFEQTKSGSMKVKEEFTPARRWSFLVGKNEKSHTAQSRLVSILANDKQDPTLKEIEKSFDIETVTKEFFLKYRELFLHTKEELDRVVDNNPKIKADFEAKGVDTVNFAKKLLGQIIFLYFLQKKGWFGVPLGKNWGDGDKKFLRNLFGRAKKEEKNYFNDYLEPLFYEALRNNRSHEDHYFSMFNCKIPFLNGGLFDPINDYDWKETDIKLPNELFSNKCDDKEGDGVLDIFDLYNFTVKEDEPLEKEVAIDPELLGKSYEKFNAIRPDNYVEFKKALKSGRKGEENKFNKKFGVYYTPREIVHYMCQQSLINYLDTAVNTHKKSIITKPAVQKKIFGPQSPVQQILTSDSYKPIIPKKDIEKLIHTGEQFGENEAIFLKKEQKIKKGEQKTTSIKLKLSDNIRKNAKLIDDKLAEITVCDPAVGSGAFPVGMMSEIVKTRNALSVFLNDKDRTAYDFKRQCIEHSLYGVDIDPGAVEIAKLRLWLSLVVDEDDIKNIKPLPNLDYRIMQGNSLISEFMGINFDDNENKNLKKEIEELNAEIKTLKKEKSDKESKSSRHYKKTIEIDQNLLNEINVRDDKINKLKKKCTLLNKKLNHQEESPEIINLISEFQKKKNNFLNESNVSRKSQLKNEVDVLLIKIFETKLKTQKADYFNRLKNIENKYSVVRNEKQRDELIKQDKEKFYKKSGFDLESAEKHLKEFTSGRKIKPFFLWNLYFSEVFHNKGGFDVIIANPPYVLGRETFDISMKKYLSKNYKAYGGKFDLYIYLTEKGISLLKTKGVLSYIVPNTLLVNVNAKNLRKLILEDSKIMVIRDFGSRVFDSAQVENIVAIIQKEQAKSDDQILIRREDESYHIFQSLFYDDLEFHFNLNLDSSTASLINKIGDASIPLGRLSDICIGVQLGGSLGKDTTKESFISHIKQDKTYKKVLDGREINSYVVNWDGRFVRYGNWLHRKRNEKYFLSPKIMIRQIGQTPIATYNEDKFYTLNTIYNLIGLNSPYSLKYFLAMINNKLGKWFWINNNSDFKALFPKIKKSQLESVPIYEIKFSIPSDKKQHDKLASIVDEILAAKKVSSTADTSALEAEIDQLVYKLYDLTPEEIKIVEGTK